MPYENLENKRFAFIGGGIIAGVFIERLLQAQVVSPQNILATDVKPERLEELKNRFGLRVSTENRDGAEFGDIIFLAVPPNVVKAVLSESCQAVRPEQIIVSLAAAIPTWLIEAVLCKPNPVVRVIPNTPSLLGEGMNPYCLGKHVLGEHFPIIDELMSVLGRSARIEESLMGAHGTRGLRRVQIGNTTEDVMRRVSMPVLSITHPIHKMIFPRRFREPSECKVF